MEAKNNIDQYIKFYNDERRHILLWAIDPLKSFANL
ncbi:MULTISPECIES: hypothetical protein [Thermoactinomyces]|nr:hypothetical protein FA954_10245 [Thermoactinomyces vulgaris]